MVSTDPWRVGAIDRYRVVLDTGEGEDFPVLRRYAAEDAGPTLDAS